MSILVYNLTTSPLTLNNGVGGAPKLVIPASTSGEVGVKGLPWYGSGDEFQGLDLAAYTALQTQQLSGLVAFEWTQAPEYPTFPLYVAAAQLDVADLDVKLYADPVTGLDSNPGTLALPLKTFEAVIDAMPTAAYKRGLRINLNIDPTTAAQNTTKKVYTLSNKVLTFLFPDADGTNAETPYIFGGYTNELGDLTATAGTTISLTTNQNLLLDQFRGAIINIVSGTGAGQEIIIRGNTAGPNSVITPETPFSPAPDATSVYRISYPNVEIQFSQNLEWVAPPQNLYIRGVKFKFVGTVVASIFIGFMYGPASGGTLDAFGCEFDFDSGIAKGALRVRGLGRFETDGVQSYWIGPNNPIIPAVANLGCYFHGASGMGTNVSGVWFNGPNLIKDCTNINVASFSLLALGSGTIENTTIGISADSNAFFAGSATLRGRIRKVTGTAVQITSLSKGIGVGGINLNNVEFSDITGDMVNVQLMGRTILGDITTAGVNTGWGLKVQTGAQVRVQSTTLLTGALGAIQLDNVGMTLAQALAAPFSGTLNSNIVQPYVITDPGNAGAIPVVVSGVCALTSLAAETRTLAAPTYVGQTLSIVANVLAGNVVVTAATGFNSTGLTVATFSAAGQALTLIGELVAGLLRWRVTGNDGFPLPVQIGTAQIAANAVDETKVATTIASAPQALPAPGAIDVVSRTTLVTTTAPGQVITLANGTRTGQRKTVTHTATSGGGTGVVTPTTPGNFATATLVNKWDSVELEWSGAVWNLVGWSGAVVIA